MFSPIIAWLIVVQSALSVMTVARMTIQTSFGPLSSDVHGLATSIFSAIDPTWESGTQTKGLNIFEFGYEISPGVVEFFEISPGSQQPILKTFAQVFEGTV